MDQQRAFAGSQQAQLFASYPARPHPPMLTFRTFHDRHFTSSQRQKFFVGAYGEAYPQSTSDWSQGDHEIAPSAYDTVADQHLHNDVYVEVHDQEAVHNEEGVEWNHCHATIAAVEPDHTSTTLQLSKEAIEIFEFSRRFREEKAAAMVLEQERFKKRRIKRRKLTKLGFAFDEGDSGSDAGDSVDADGANGLKELGKAEDDENGSDDDQESTHEELPPTDVSFFGRKSRKSTTMRQRLYGERHDAGSGVVPAAGGAQAIEMLENLLNQTYEDSLGSCAPAEKDPGESKRQGSRGGEYRPTDRQGQVVYWPGMPLRC